MADFTMYECILLGIVILFVLRGLWLGCIRQSSGLLSLVLACVLGCFYQDLLNLFFGKFSANPRIVFCLSFIFIFLSLYGGLRLFGRVMSRLITITIVPWLNRMVGAVFGFCQAIIIIGMIHLSFGALFLLGKSSPIPCRTCGRLTGVVNVYVNCISDENLRKLLIVPVRQEIFLEKEKSGFLREQHSKSKN